MKTPSLRLLFAGSLLAGGLLLALTRLGELERFVLLLVHLEPAWIAASLLLQAATYFSLAMVWRSALVAGGSSSPLGPLLPIAVGKLFADQALPTGGISGIAFFISALKNRGVEARLCMGAMIVTILSYYGAYAAAAALSIVELALRQEIQRWIMVASAMFLVIAAAIPIAVLRLQQVGVERLPSWLRRRPVVAGFLDLYRDAPSGMVRNPALLMQATIWQFTIFVLDGATLWALLKALGHEVSPMAAFACFVVASMAAVVTLLPMGLGSFEAASTALLLLNAVPLETALAATLLLRGFTLWLPLLPGLWLVKRELGAKRGVPVF